jgi:hypothetical protein
VGRGGLEAGPTLAFAIRASWSPSSSTCPLLITTILSAALRDRACGVGAEAPGSTERARPPLKRLSLKREAR